MPESGAEGLLERIGVTATRRVREVEPSITLDLVDLPMSVFVVGGCYGGDCLVAREALRIGHQVHTVLPTRFGQLCPHWKDFLHGADSTITWDGSRDLPHTTTWEMMEPSEDEPYRRRDARIVELSTRRLFAWPDRREQQAYSGVTMTINIARRAGKEVLVRILHPVGATV